MKKIQELLSLKGRVAVITGGGGHIGSAFCEALAEAGATIVVLDKETARAQTTVGTISSKLGSTALPLTVDLAEEDQVRDVPARVVEQLGRIDILVNCAALGGASELEGWAVPFEQQSSHTWRQALETNLTAAFVLAQACTQPLRVSGNGTIINVGSIYGMLGPDMHLYEETAMGNPAAYAAGKGGLLQLTRWLATVLAPEIRVNAISPGGVWRDQPEAFQKKYIARTPLKRMATEQDLTGAVVYLASDLSSYVTGHNLVVDGGWTVW